MSATDHRWAQGLFIFDPLCGIFLVIMFFYFALLEGLLGATAGKKLMGLQVVGLNGKNPGLVPGLLRNLLRLVDGLPAFSILGIYLIVTSPERARYGDRVAKTRVMVKWDMPEELKLSPENAFSAFEDKAENTIEKTNDCAKPANLCRFYS